MAEGHRKRVKQRVSDTGFAGMTSQNVLEFILFYAIPRKDVAPLAARLIEKFGSFSGVVEAGHDELKMIDGLSEHTITMIRAIPEIVSHYYADKQYKNINLTTLCEVGEYLVRLYFKDDNERIHLLLLDNKYSLISCTEVFKGNVTASAADIKMLAQLALQSKAASVILAHNHPSGIAYPSPEDIIITEKVKSAFDILEISFTDHYIVAGNKYYSVINQIMN